MFGFQVDVVGELWEWVEDVVEGGGSWVVGFEAPAGWGRSVVFDELEARGEGVFFVRVRWPDAEVADRALVAVRDDVGRQVDDLVESPLIPDQVRVFCRARRGGFTRPLELAAVAELVVGTLAVLGATSVGFPAPIGLALGFAGFGKAVRSISSYGQQPSMVEQLASALTPLRLLARSVPIVVFVDGVENASAQDLGVVLDGLVAPNSVLERGGQRLLVVTAGEPGLTTQRLTRWEPPHGVTVSELESSVAAGLSPVRIAELVQDAFPGSAEGVAAGVVERVEGWDDLTRLFAEKGDERALTVEIANAGFGVSAAERQLLVAARIAGQLVTDCQLELICRVLDIEVAPARLASLFPLVEGTIRRVPESAFDLRGEQRDTVVEALTGLALSEPVTSDDLVHLGSAAEHDHGLRWRYAETLAERGAMRAAVKAAERARVFDDPEKRSRIDLWDQQVGQVSERAANLWEAGETWREGLCRLAAVSLNGGVDEVKLSGLVHRIPAGVAEGDLVGLADLALRAGRGDLLAVVVEHAGIVPGEVEDQLRNAPRNIWILVDLVVRADQLRLLGQLNPDPVGYAVDAHRLAFDLYAAGRFKHAAEWGHIASTNFANYLGANHPGTLASRHELARYQWELAQTADEKHAAMQDMKQLVTDEAETLPNGANHPGTLHSRHELARYQWELAQTADEKHAAMQDMKQLVTDEAETLPNGANHPDTLTSRHELARYQWELAQTADEKHAAMQDMKQLVTDRTETLPNGANHPDTLHSRHNLTICQWELAQTADEKHAAMQDMKQLVTDRTETLPNGANHPDTLHSRHNLTRYQWELAQTADEKHAAMQDMKQLVTDRTETLPNGANHPDTLTIRHNLARYQWELAQTADEKHAAMQDMKQLVTDRTETLPNGANHPSTLTSRHELARYQWELAQTADEKHAAMQDMKQLVTDRTETLPNGANHPSTLTIRHNLTICQWELAQTADEKHAAMQDMKQLVTDRTETLPNGANHPDTLHSRHNLTRYQWELAQTADEKHAAMQDMKQLVTDRTETLPNGANHPSTLTSRHNLTICQWELAQTADETHAAMQDMKQIVTDSINVLGASHPDTLARMRTLFNMTTEQ